MPFFVFIQLKNHNKKGERSPFWFLVRGMTALGSVGVPVPKTLALCEDSRLKIRSLLKQNETVSSFRLS